MGQPQLCEARTPIGSPGQIWCPARDTQVIPRLIEHSEMRPAGSGLPGAPPTPRMPLMRMPKTASGQTWPAGPGPAAPENGGPAGLPGARARLREAVRHRMIPGLRRHWLISALLLAGLVLRLLTHAADLVLHGLVLHRPLRGILDRRQRRRYRRVRRRAGFVGLRLVR